MKEEPCNLQITQQTGLLIHQSKNFNKSPATSPETAERGYFSLDSLHKPINIQPYFWYPVSVSQDLVEWWWNVNPQCCTGPCPFLHVVMRPSSLLPPGSFQCALFQWVGFQKKWLSFLGSPVEVRWEIFIFHSYSSLFALTLNFC